MQWTLFYLQFAFRDHRGADVACTWTPFLFSILPADTYNHAQVRLPTAGMHSRLARPVPHACARGRCRGRPVARATRRAGFLAFAAKPPRFRGPVAALLPAAAPPTAAPFALKLSKAELLAFRGVPRAIAVASLPRGY
jgi:hypothetical protein